MTTDLPDTTTLKGTNFRVGQVVRGECANATCSDPHPDALLYDTHDDPTLLCAHCSRVRSLANPRKETCDTCGVTDAWRDPVSGKNEFFCALHHAQNGTVFQNRWARTDAPRTLNAGRAQCAAANHGTECKGEIKWRAADNMSLCNKHAGKRSANEANN